MCLDIHEALDKDRDSILVFFLKEIILKLYHFNVQLIPRNTIQYI